MIGKIKRGNGLRKLLWYLWGPGRCNEHTDPHLVAGWDDATALEPLEGVGVTADIRPLARLLEQPLHAAVRLPSKTVWHCSLRAAPEDRTLTDGEWAEIAADVLHRTGLAARGDDRAVRWIAMRHAPDHIHIVATLARQDGKPAQAWNDFYRVREACHAAEERSGLRATAPADSTAPRAADRGETEKAHRQGRREPARATLRRHVRQAAAATHDDESFFAALRDLGVMVRPRHSSRNLNQITGYAVAMPGDHTAAGTPVWYGGGRLAADLTLPRLRRRWATHSRTARQHGQRIRPPRARGEGRSWQRDAQAAAAGAADAIRGGDDGAAHAAADLFTTTARAFDGDRGGLLTDAADVFDRAARPPGGRPLPPTTSADALRTAARAMALASRISGDDDTMTLLALLRQLSALAAAVAELRAAQSRAAQAAAARHAARLATAAQTTTTSRRASPKPQQSATSRHQGGPIR